MNDVLTPQEMIDKAVEDSSWNKELKRFGHDVGEKLQRLLYDDRFSAKETDMREQVAMANALKEYFQSDDHFGYINSMKRALSFFNNEDVALESMVLFGDPVDFSPNHSEEVRHLSEYQQYKERRSQAGL